MKKKDGWWKDKKHGDRKKRNVGGGEYTAWEKLGQSMKPKYSKNYGG